MGINPQPPNTGQSNKQSKRQNSARRKTRYTVIHGIKFTKKNLVKAGMLLKGHRIPKERETQKTQGIKDEIKGFLQSDVNEVSSSFDPEFPCSSVKLRKKR